MSSNTPSYTFFQKTMAWATHAFTASGLVTGFLALLSIHEARWRDAMFWLIVSFIIDGVDGTFARFFKVKEVLPYMDGKTIDYVIDFATYAIIPAFFFHECGLVSGPMNIVCVSAMLLSAALYYGKDGMVSNDMYFVGFPVLWNMIVFYLFFIGEFGEAVNIAVIFFFTALHFLPVKFVYPSQATRLRSLSVGASILFFIALLAVVYYYPERPDWAIWATWITGSYYAVMAVIDTWFWKD